MFRGRSPDASNCDIELRHGHWIKKRHGAAGMSKPYALAMLVLVCGEAHAGRCRHWCHQRGALSRDKEAELVPAAILTGWPRRTVNRLLICGAARR